MGFHRVAADPELVGNLRVAHPAGDQGEDLALPRRKGNFFGALPVTGRKVAFAATGPAQGGNKSLQAFAFGNHGNSPVLQCPAGNSRRVNRGVNHDPGLLFLAYLFQQGEVFAFGQDQIKTNQVGFVTLDGPETGFTVLGQGNKSQARRAFKDLLQPIKNGLVIINYDN